MRAIGNTVADVIGLEIEFETFDSSGKPANDSTTAASVEHKVDTK